MNDQDEPLRGTDEGTGQLPPIGHAVWVRCKSYRTMAYRDTKGVWRALADGEEVTGIVKVGWPEQD